MIYEQCFPWFVLNAGIWPEIRPCLFHSTSLPIHNAWSTSHLKVQMISWDSDIIIFIYNENKLLSANLDQYYIYFLDTSKRFKHSKILRIIKLMALYVMWSDENCTAYMSWSLSLLSSLCCLFTSQTYTQKYLCWVRILYIINFSRYKWKAWDNKDEY